MSIFIMYEKISEVKALVTHQDYVPNSLTPEILEKGILVEEIPAIEPQFNKTEILYINPINNEFFYEYIDRPLTPSEEIEQLKQENGVLKQSQAEQDALIMQLLLGGA